MFFHPLKLLRASPQSSKNPLLKKQNLSSLGNYFLYVKKFQENDRGVSMATVCPWNDIWRNNKQKLQFSKEYQISFENQFQRFRFCKNSLSHLQVLLKNTLSTLLIDQIKVRKFNDWVTFWSFLWNRFVRFLIKL